jgi:hypothetical protein
MHMLEFVMARKRTTADVLAEAVKSFPKYVKEVREKKKKREREFPPFFF